MATSPNSTILSRRNALAAAGAALTFAALPITPANSTETDHEAKLWMTKWQRLVAADEAYSTAVVQAENAQIAAREEYPTAKLYLPGTCIVFRNGHHVPTWSDYSMSNKIVDLSGLHNITRFEIEQHFEDHLTGKYAGNSKPGRAEFIEDGRNRCRKALSEFDRWSEACGEIDKRYGVPALDEAEIEASEAFEDAENDIINSVSTSFAAIAVKLALWHTERGGTPDAYAPERSAMSALVGATALAGLPAEFWVIRRDTGEAVASESAVQS